MQQEEAAKECPWNPCHNLGLAVVIYGFFPIFWI
jgi:hypothetical protein